MPPYLAGREVQKQAGLACLNSMRAGHPFGRCLVLWGSRGNEKTVMLLWIEREALERGIQVVSLESADIEKKDDLATRISGPLVGSVGLGEFRSKACNGKPAIRSQMP